MLSQKARYALRALFVLAKSEPDKPVLIGDIAAKANIPRKFLEQILVDLKRHGLVYSQRGKFGGYYLARTPDRIAFAEVIRAMDGPLALTPCASVTAYRRCDDCVDEETCSIRKVLLVVRDATAGILEGCTLADALSKDPLQARAPAIAPLPRGKSRAL
jgi:Rrf2 family protein